MVRDKQEIQAGRNTLKTHSKPVVSANMSADIKKLDGKLSPDGTVKVCGKIVGVWIREDSLEVGVPNTFHFASLDSDEPVVSCNSVTKFRVEIGEYVRKNSIQGITPQKSDKPKSELKSVAAKHSHVSRQLNAGKPLKGKALQTALKNIADPKLANKLQNGEALTNEEHSYIVDVLLVHSRLG